MKLLNLPKTAVIAVLALGAMVLSPAAFADTEIKIGVVDIPTAIQATKEGKKIKDQLQKEVDKKKSEMDKKAKDIQTMQQDLEKKSLVLSDEAKMKKIQEIEEAKAKFMELREKNFVDLEKRDRELSQPILKKLNDVIGDIAKNGKYTAIFHKNDRNLVWASKEIDITDEVIKRLEKK